MPYHFHFLIRTRTEVVQRSINDPQNAAAQPRLMLLFSNPHPYSVQQGIFLSLLIFRNWGLQY
jgi:hypothetical protein